MGAERRGVVWKVQVDRCQLLELKAGFHWKPVAPAMLFEKEYSR